MIQFLRELFKPTYYIYLTPIELKHIGEQQFSAGYDEGVEDSCVTLTLLQDSLGLTDDQLANITAHLMVNASYGEDI
jgi:hypothetical protein